jgi:uncharacterized protein YjbI with pentapeptide repeats
MSEAVGDTPEDQNSWYMLATLFGEMSVVDNNGARHTQQNFALTKKNRSAWNRWMITHLDEKGRQLLADKAQSPFLEIKPLSKTELSTLRRTMIKRGISREFIDQLESKKHKMIVFPADISDGTFDLSNMIFPIRVSFEGRTFQSELNIHQSFFMDYAIFNHCTFCGPVSMGSSIFIQYAPFQNCRFDSYVNFGSVNFAGSTDFEASTFAGHADFNRANFHGYHQFNKVRFADKAIFYDATFQFASFRHAAFENGADFGYAQFHEGAAFHGSSFKSAERGPVNEHYQRREELEQKERPDRYWHGASFKNACFGRDVDFQNTQFLASASFGGAVFETTPPFFFGAVFHEGMEWRGVQWPLPKSNKNAGNFVDAYACLKLEMDRLKRHEDELDFFALELQARRAMAGWWRGLPIGLYGWFCDYGRSFVRPTLGLLATWLILAIPFLQSSGPPKFREAVGIGLANTFGILGFRKDFIPSSVIEILPDGLIILSGIQTVLGAVFLSLITLSIRNRFRMK